MEVEQKPTFGNLRHHLRLKTKDHRMQKQLLVLFILVALLAAFACALPLRQTTSQQQPADQSSDQQTQQPIDAADNSTQQQEQQNANQTSPTNNHDAAVSDLLVRQALSLISADLKRMNQSANKCFSQSQQQSSFVAGGQRQQPPAPFQQDEQLNDGSFMTMNTLKEETQLYAPVQATPYTRDDTSQMPPSQMGAAGSQGQQQQIQQQQRACANLWDESSVLLQNTMYLYSLLNNLTESQTQLITSMNQSATSLQFTANNSDWTSFRTILKQYTAAFENFSSPYGQGSQPQQQQQPIPPQQQQQQPYQPQEEEPCYYHRRRRHRPRYHRRHHYYTPMWDTDEDTWNWEPAWEMFDDGIIGNEADFPYGADY